MRISELNPKWIGIDGQLYGLNGKALCGIRFNCPHCGERLAVMFKPFIDPNNLYRNVAWAFPDAPNPNTGEVSSIKFWDRTGDTFENLTLAPSIDCSASGHWHGFIKNGEVT